MFVNHFYLWFLSHISILITFLPPSTYSYVHTYTYISHTTKRIVGALVIFLLTNRISSNINNTVSKY